jgi:hypothetical protein
MSIKSQKANMKSIYGLVSEELGHIYGPKESGPNGNKVVFHRKSKAFLRALGNDLGLKEFKVTNNYGGIAVSGEIALMGLWSDGNGIYFELSQSLSRKQEFLYRSISHIKDYRGGQNMRINGNLFKTADYEAVLKSLLALKSPTEAEVVNRHAA